MPLADAASDRVREIALGLLQRHGQVDPVLSHSIYQEPTTFDHAWLPDLTDIHPDYQSGACQTEERVVTTFIYGGLLFGAFADQANAAHCLHDKRRRLDLEIARDESGRNVEAELEEALNEQYLTRYSGWMQCSDHCGTPGLLGCSATMENAITRD